MNHRAYQSKLGFAAVYWTIWCFRFRIVCNKVRFLGKRYGGQSEEMLRGGSIQKSAEVHHAIIWFWSQQFANIIQDCCYADWGLRGRWVLRQLMTYRYRDYIWWYKTVLGVLDFSWQCFFLVKDLYALCCFVVRLLSMLLSISERWACFQLSPKKKKRKRHHHF